MRIVYLLFATAALAFPAPKNAPNQVTFNRDVLPLLQKNCQGCHRPGEAAPMSFLTYKDTRPWAKGIREAVLTHKMPPWFADPHVGKFANDRSLSPAEIDTFVRWADAGAPEGNPKDRPAPREFVEGWNIGKPDLVLEMSKAFEVPASGTIDYTYFVIPTGFTEDRWIQMAEARPGNRKVVHHIIAFVREPGSKWMRDIKLGEPFVPKKDAGRSPEGGLGEAVAGYAPGTIPEILEPGRAKLIKAGSDIILQMHYTSDGKVETDQTRVGLVFAKEPPKERVMGLAASNTKFVVPAGDPNFKVESKITLQEDTTLLAFTPHMHLRGKDFEYRIVYPNGETTKALWVPNYSFSWQLSYYPEKPLNLPKGTTIECTAHFDNSANNPNNPDPKVDVKFGEQSWDEMMFGFFSVAFDVNKTPRDLLVAPKKKAPADD